MIKKKKKIVKSLSTDNQRYVGALLENKEVDYKFEVVFEKFNLILI